MWSVRKVRERRSGRIGEIPYLYGGEELCVVMTGGVVMRQQDLPK
jgi:hypothetical protein